jgi:hypothetical protein
MFQHPSITEAIARDRIAEATQRAQLTALKRASRRPSAVAAARNATGWLLVDLGLRLTVPRHSMRYSADSSR